MLVPVLLQFPFCGTEMVCGTKEDLGQLKAEGWVTPQCCTKVSCPESAPDNPYVYKMLTAFCLIDSD